MTRVGRETLNSGSGSWPGHPMTPRLMRTNKEDCLGVWMLSEGGGTDQSGTLS